MKKEHWFKISLVILPLVILLLIEIFLRIFDLFTPEPLFISIKKNDTELYQLNTAVAKRYFNKKQTTVPNLLPETFTKYKEKKTIRIFCLGGSTTAGFPFDYQIPFPFQLRKILEARHPEYEFEVLNMGISAINSYTVLDFIPDILSVEPDYIIIYMGHNEFYGAYGSGSTMSGGMAGGLIRFYLKLKKFNLVTMLETVLRSFAKAPERNGQDKTLMELVSRDKDIEYGSEIYSSTIQNFNENLKQILNNCSDKNVPVILGNLVCNLKDQPPFQSSEQIGKVHASTAEIESMVDKLIEKPLNEREKEITQYQKELNFTANAYFNLAERILNLGDTITAKFCYSKARDLDLIRFRASDELNQIINNITGKGITIVCIDSVFQANSEYGIPGNDLFTDHLHPTPHGYYLMANAFSKAMDIASNDHRTNSYPNDVLYITDVDMEMGLIKIYNLKHHWPFANKVFNFKHYKTFGEPKAAEIAYDYINNHFNWSKAHYQMAAYYISNSYIQKARNEYEAVHYYYEDLADPLFKIGETYAIEKNWTDAEIFYKKAISKTTDKGFIYKALANVQWKQHKMVDAVNSIQYAILAFNNNIEHQTQAKFMLANMLIDMKRPKDSKMILKDLLKYYPQYKPAIKMLKQLDAE
jgi:tetratricopeptide (TPR) repeat protein